MTELRFKRRKIVLYLLVFLCMLSAFLVFACSSPTEKRTPEVTGGPPVGTREPEVISEQGAVFFGPGAFNLSKPATGLSALSSYKATLSLSFDGVEAGKPSRWSQTYVMLSKLQPASRQLTIEKSGLSEPETVFMAEVDGVAYKWRGKDSCTATTIGLGDSLAEQMEPALLLTGIIGGEESGSDTVNGIAATRYTFDERALGQSGTATSTGELWIASQGGYVVKYVLTMQGGADYFGEGADGKLTWNYQLTNVNQPLVVTLPVDCPTGMVDAPLMPGATDVVNMPGLLSFITATSMVEASSFYAQKLPPLGWQAVGDSVIANTVALKDFTRKNQQMSVNITSGSGITTVHIVVELKP